MAASSSFDHSEQFHLNLSILASESADENGDQESPSAKEEDTSVDEDHDEESEESPSSAAS